MRYRSKGLDFWRLRVSGGVVVVGLVVVVMVVVVVVVAVVVVVIKVPAALACGLYWTEMLCRWPGGRGGGAGGGMCSEWRL